jgi:hypothetical protein
MRKKIKISAFADEMEMELADVVANCKEFGWGKRKTIASWIQPEQIEEFLKLYPAPPNLLDQPQKDADLSSDNTIGTKSLCDSNQEHEVTALPEQTVEVHEVVSEEEINIALDGSYIAMDCHDLREILSSGYLAPIHYYSDIEFKSPLAVLNSWSVLNKQNNYAVEGGILAGKKPCLVRIDDWLVDNEEYFSRTIPASEIKEVVFQEEKQQKDFIARNSSIRGFPTNQLIYVLEPKLNFVLQSSEFNDDDNDPNAVEVQQEIIETNRVMGAIATLVKHGNLRSSQFEFIENSKEFNFKTLVNLIADIGVPYSSSAGNWIKRIEIILETICADEWISGFTGNALRESIVESFNKINDDFARPFENDSLIQMLDSMAVVPPQMLTDDRNQLLRGLFLFLKSANGNIMDNLLHWQQRDGQDKPADVIVNIAFLLTGWYHGFRKMPTLKGDDAFSIYRFCSRNLANSVDFSDAYKNNLRVEQDQIDYFTKTTAIYDSDYKLSETTVKADPSLMEAHAAIMQIDSLVDTKVEFDMDQSLIRVFISDTVILGFKHKPGIMRWQSTWTMKDKRGKRKWSEQQRDCIANIAKDSSCALYVLVDEFPSCGLHVDQKLSTMDHGEIAAHLEWIIESSAKLSEVLEPSE